MWQIQNFPIWEAYQGALRQAKVDEAKLPQEELELWHGTSSNDPKAIFGGNNGFNINYSRDGLRGFGLYFAQNSCYSVAGYSH